MLIVFEVMLSSDGILIELTCQRCANMNLSEVCGP